MALQSSHLWLKLGQPALHLHPAGTAGGGGHPVCGDERAPHHRSQQSRNRPPVSLQCCGCILWRSCWRQPCAGGRAVIDCKVSWPCTVRRPIICVTDCRLNYFLIDRGPNSAMGAKVEGFRGKPLGKPCLSVVALQEAFEMIDVFLLMAAACTKPLHCPGSNRTCPTCRAPHNFHARRCQRCEAAHAGHCGGARL